MAWLKGVTVKTRGLAQLPSVSKPFILVSNWLSEADTVILDQALPAGIAFILDPAYENEKWVQAISSARPLHFLNARDSEACAAMTKRIVTEKKPVLLFPENRPSTTGGIMKIYPNLALMVAESKLPVYSITLDGSQRTPYASDKNGQVKHHRMEVSVNVQAPCPPFAEITGAGKRKEQAQSWLKDAMAEAALAAADTHHSLFDQLLISARLSSLDKAVLQDAERSMSYKELIVASIALGHHFRKSFKPGERVGLMIPSSVGGVITFYALQAIGVTPALINFTAGKRNIELAMETVRAKTVLTSRRFVLKAQLQELVDALEQKGYAVVYLEEVKKQLGLSTKLRALLAKLAPVRMGRAFAHPGNAQDEAVILFTSGSEGAPKGVVLSHHNLLINVAQILTRIAINGRDVFLNTLPLFHSSGLTGGTLLPLIAGAKAWLYPNPLHYQLVPDLAYRADATILFATDTFLNGYARFADSYDYYRLRFAVAGAEKLKAETRHLWADKFGVAIYEGYGVTETAPVLAVNTPMANKPGTVGRMMPGMECKIVPVPGIAEGGELHVKGPNVMKGYIFHAQPDTLVPPADGWHATGDIVAVDEEGYLRILGRAKRFAKIAGEMISLPAVEEAISVLWKDAAHAVVSVNDPKRGEQLVLVTTQPNADRDPLVRHFHQSGMPEISLPKTIIILPELPLLGSGKTDYVTITAQAQAHLNKQKAA